MKVKVNFTIEGESGSERVEYFLTITSKSIVDLIGEKESPLISGKKDLKRAFYEEQAQKYGF